MIQNDDDGSFTQMAMPQQGQAPSHGLYVQFFLHPVQNAEKTLEEGRPIYDEIEYIRIMVPGDKSSVIERPIRLGHGENFDNFKYGPEYGMFKQGVKDALVGTPLSEWAAISRSQVKELEYFNVRTLEQLAQMPDTAIQNFNGVSSLREQAKRFITDAKDGSIVAQMQSELEIRDNTIQTLMNQVSEMQKSISELQKTPLVDKPTVTVEGKTKRRGIAK